MGGARLIQRIERNIPIVPSKSRRWVSEMEEIQATFEHLGMTPHLFQGVADMYRMIGDTPLADETPEDIRGQQRDFKAVIQTLAGYVNPKAD